MKTQAQDCQLSTSDISHSAAEGMNETSGSGSDGAEGELSASHSQHNHHHGVALLHEALELVSAAQYPKALDYLRQYLAIAREDHDEVACARAFRNIGVVYLKLKQPQRALDFLIEGLACTKRLSEVGGDENRSSEAKLLMHMGVAHELLGQVELALAFLAKAVQAADRCGGVKVAGAARGHMGRMFCQQGHYRDAIAAHDAAIELAEIANDAEGVRLATQQRTVAMQAYRRFREAKEALRRRR